MTDEATITTTIQSKTLSSETKDIGHKPYVIFIPVSRS
jgi:hypothetical protein